MPNADKPAFGPTTGFRFLNYDIYPNEDGGLTVLEGIVVKAQIDPQKAEEFKNFIVAANDAPHVAAETAERAGAEQWKRAAIEFAQGHLIFTSEFIDSVKCNDPAAAFAKLGYIDFDFNEHREAIESIKMTLRVHYNGTNMDPSTFSDPAGCAEEVAEIAKDLKSYQQYAELHNYFVYELDRLDLIESGAPDTAAATRACANVMLMELRNLFKMRAHWGEIVKLAHELVDRRELYTLKPGSLMTTPPGEGYELHTILTLEPLTGPEIIQALRDTWLEDNTPGIRIMAITNMIEDFLKSRGILLHGTAEEAVESLLALIADPIALKKGTGDAST